MANLSQALNPLKVLIVAARADTLERYKSTVTAVQRAFQGCPMAAVDPTETYFATGEELGIDVRSLSWIEPNGGLQNARMPANSAPDLILDSCGKLLIVALLDRTVAEPREFSDWLDDVSELARTSGRGRIGVLPLSVASETTVSTLKNFDQIQRVPLEQLGEPAARAGNAALLALTRAWGLLNDNPEQRLQIFISHAKADGLPIALAIESLIGRLRWLTYFYDATAILPGSFWQEVLRRGVQQSAVLVLRTDAYERRFWCVQELDWAEEVGCPVVAVDLRHELLMPREPLPLNDVPTTRIPDGNIMRALNALVREALRIELFRNSVEYWRSAKQLSDSDILRVNRLTLGALARACEHRLASSAPLPQYVLVPNPFRETLRTPSEKMVSSYFPSATLSTVAQQC